ncbi:MAG: Hpt domain-containing protein [Candidatus Omnitrophica bacterium]|nr:Hpt domain-containing protein [Candidatus Omnitrophota bacterium]
MSEETIDLAEFMERVQDDKELLLELLDIFMEDFQEKRRQLGDAIEKNDVEQVKSIAHSLKGASGNISAKPLRQSCLKLEEIGKEGKLDGGQELLVTIDQQYQDLVKRIETLKEELNS